MSSEVFRRRLAARTSTVAIAASVTMTLGACSNSAPKVTSPTGAILIPGPPSPTPTIPDGTVSGRVVGRTADGDAPLAGVKIDGWVQTPAHGWAIGFRDGLVTSTADGRFAFSAPPGADVYLRAVKPGWQQPCGLTTFVNVSSELTDQVLVAEGTDVPADLVSTPIVTGTVFDATPQGQPAVNASVAFEPMPDLYIGMTDTDVNGHYTLCNLPLVPSTAAWIEAGNGDNFVDVRVDTYGPGVNHFDIVLRPPSGGTR